MGGGTVAAPRLSIDSMVGAFGELAAGSVSTPITFQISNAGGDYTGPLEVVLTGDRFRLATNSCTNDTVFSGAFCEVSVTFAPVAVAGSVGRLTIRGTPGGEVSASLTGTGTAPTTATLTVSKSGTGSGLITGMGINCGSDCSELGPINRQVTLTAVAMAGSQFAGWTGCDSAMDATCSVTMASSRAVTANFTGSSTGTVTLTVNKVGTGSGTVTGMGISCGADCTEAIAVGTSVMLTAMPATNATFAGFVGCDAVAGRVCTVVLNGSRTVTATFDVSASDYTLTVVKAGSGTGTVTGTGIACGTDCNEVVPMGTMRTVTATPSGSSVLSNWAGCDTVSGLDCIVTMSSNRTVTATFTATAAPATPTMLTGVITASGAAELRWVDVASNEVDYRIDRSVLPTSGFTEIATLPADSTMATIPSLGIGTHYFRVRATNTGGSSAPSNTAVLTIAPPMYPLTVVKAGLGSGTVTSAPMGISCGMDCNETLAGGTVVVLTAVPSPGSTFTSWSGCSSSTATTCTVSMSAATTVTAFFGIMVGSLTVTVPTGSTNGTYTVSWSCAAGSCGTPYTLDEDVNSSFANPNTTMPGAATSQAYTNKADGRYCYRVRTPMMSSNAACITVSRPASTGILRVQNGTHYDVIDLRLNGVQHTNFTYQLPVSQSYDAVFPPGTVSYEIGVGFWNGSNREVWFLYSGTATITAGQTTTIGIDNPTLEQMLTNFGTGANWDGAYLSNSTLRTRRMRFLPTGAYTLFDNAMQIGVGTVQLVSWPDYATSITFRLCNPVCGGTPIQLAAPFSMFTAHNGPTEAPDIEYYLQ